MSLSRVPKSIHRGMTLIELLIVLSIVALLMAFAIPAMRPALKGRRTREAARGLNLYCTSAQIRAKQLGRPCGVVIQRLEGVPECSMVLRQAEVPPPYAGDLMDAVVRLQDWTNVYNPETDPSPYYSPDRSVIVKVQIRTQGDLSPGLVHYGDLVQINHQGPLFEIVRDPYDDAVVGDCDFPLVNPNNESEGIDFNVGADNNGDDWIDTHVLTLRLPPERGQTVAWPDAPDPPNDPNGEWALPENWSPPQPFEILRQPMATNARPLQLPAGTVIDLTYSGFDSADPTVPPLSFAPTAGDVSPIYIMFSPNGSVNRIYSTNTEIAGQVIDPIYLLIGKRENVPYDPNEPDSKPNWRELTNLWVTLHPQTGLVSTTEVAVPEDDDPLNDLYESRQFARQARTMGGR